MWNKKSQNLQNSHTDMCLVLKLSTMKWMTKSIMSDYHRNIIWTQESLPWFGPLGPGNRGVPSSLIFQADRKKIFFVLFQKLNPIHLILCHWSVKLSYCNNLLERGKPGSGKLVPLVAYGENYWDSKLQWDHSLS